LFQLRLHFVLKERIGIDEIGAEQLLTIGVHRASASSITSKPKISIAQNITLTESDKLTASTSTGATCSASDSISFSKNESESRKSAQRLS
jgi:hypothetical protein